MRHDKQQSPSKIDLGKKKNEDYIDSRVREIILGDAELLTVLRGIK